MAVEEPDEYETTVGVYGTLGILSAIFALRAPFVDAEEKVYMLGFDGGDDPVVLAEWSCLGEHRAADVRCDLERKGWICARGMLDVARISREWKAFRRGEMAA